MWLENMTVEYIGTEESSNINAEQVPTALLVEPVGVGKGGTSAPGFDTFSCVGCQQETKS